MSLARRAKQRGSAMLVTMIVIASLLAGAAVLASMQLTSNRSTELTRTGLAALYCAEAGLTASHSYVVGNYAQWNAALNASCVDDGDCKTLIQPTWLGPATFSHDIDGDGVDDFTVSIRDNDDETVAQVYSADVDDRIFVVSRCTKYPDTPRQVEELILYKPAMNPYCNQANGANSRNNSNDCPP